MADKFGDNLFSYTVEIPADGTPVKRAIVGKFLMCYESDSGITFQVSLDGEGWFDWNVGMSLPKPNGFEALYFRSANGFASTVRFYAGNLLPVDSRLNIVRDPDHETTLNTVAPATWMLDFASPESDCTLTLDNGLAFPIIGALNIDQFPLGTVPLGTVEDVAYSLFWSQQVNLAVDPDLVAQSLISRPRRVRRMSLRISVEETNEAGDPLLLVMHRGNAGLGSIKLDLAAGTVLGNCTIVAKIYPGKNNGTVFYTEDTQHYMLINPTDNNAVKVCLMAAYTWPLGFAAVDEGEPDV